MLPNTTRWYWLAGSLLTLTLSSGACTPKVTAPLEPTMAVRRGDEWFRYEEYDAAINAYRSYLDQDDDTPYMPRVYYKTALAEYRLGRYRDALATLDELTQHYPKGHWVQVDALRGDAERELGHSVIAIESWDRAWNAADSDERSKLRTRIASVAHGLDDLQLAKARRLVNAGEVRELLDQQIALRQPGSIDEAMPDTDTGEPVKVAKAKGQSAATKATVRTPKGTAKPATAQAVPPAALATDESTAERAAPAPFVPEPEPVEGAAAKPVAPAPVPATRQAPPPSAPVAIARAEPAPRGPTTEEVLEPQEPIGATEPLERPEPEVAPKAMAEAPPAVVDEPIQGNARIGCLLPLTGPNRQFGERSLRGLRLLFGQDNDQLVIKDTGSDPSVAVSMYQELARMPNVLAIVGPLLSDDAAAVAPLAEQDHLPMLILSQRDGLGGRFVIQSGMTRTHQVETLLAYAMDKARLRRFGVLYPKDHFGQELVATFRREVERRGGEVVGTDGYAPGTRGVATGTVKQWRNAQNMQAVFVPDDAAAAAQFARFLQREMPDVTLLGVQGWETLADTNGAAPPLNGVVFADGFYANSARPATREFVDRFVQTYGQDPSAVEAQAYDAGLLAKRALDAGANARTDTLRHLLALDSVEGATGELRVTSDGVQRPLFLLQVYDGKLSEVGGAG